MPSAISDTMYLVLDVPRVLLRLDAAPRLLPAGEVPRSSSERSSEDCLGCMGKGWDGMGCKVGEGMSV